MNIREEISRIVYEFSYNSKTSDDVADDIMALLPPELSDGWQVQNEIMRKLIARTIAPEALALWLRKNEDYAGQQVFLGSKAQFADINRKFWKLKQAMWDGVAPAYEKPDEIMMDMIGHLFMSIFMYRYPPKRPCGKTRDETFCACGCGGDDSRCGHWHVRQVMGDEVDPDHTCCKVFRG